MAVSGTTTFSLNKNELLELAFARAGLAPEEGQALSSAKVDRGSKILNSMIKAWLGLGFRLWKTKRGYLFLEAEENEYLLDGSTANATTSYVNPTLSTAASSSDISIIVSSATGISVGYNIGIVQDDNIVLWTTVASIASTTIGLNAALTSDASSGNNVFVYETKLGRIENLINAQLKENVTIEIPMAIMARDTYDAMATKNLTGIPTQIYYNKQLTTGTFRLFPAPSNPNYIVKFTWQENLYDMTDPTDDFDFPQEWYDALYLNLSFKLTGFYSVKDQEFISRLKEEAFEALSRAMMFDDENGSVYFHPASDQNRGGFV